ncbi:hypothetical protein M1N22_03585 [Dehalococcoidia bacterium]|nr:hypothetical protein [Dehalococcoidia bacterium]
MNTPKCKDYINFLVAAQKAFSAVEASKTHPAGDDQRMMPTPVCSTEFGRMAKHCGLR